MLFLVTAQWEFPLQQPMKCYCIIIHLLRPIRTYQQRKKFNLNSPLCAKEWPGHEIKAQSSVLQWFATPRHNRVRERDIPALPGFPDPGERGGGGGLITGWFEGGGWWRLRRWMCQIYPAAPGGQTASTGRLQGLGARGPHCRPDRPFPSLPCYWDWGQWSPWI